jgi:hypothetical protein
MLLTRMTKPRRVKSCDKKKTQTNDVHTMQLTTVPPTWPETMPDKFMRKEIKVQNDNKKENTQTNTLQRLDLHTATHHTIIKTSS